MGAIFAVMKLNSRPCGVHYKGRANGHPHCSLAKRDCEGPEGWSGLVGLGRWGTYRRGGLRVRLEEGEGRGLAGENGKKRHCKHFANGLKRADNTTEIKGEAETRRPLLKQMAAGFFVLRLNQKERTASFICRGESFQRASLRAGK